MRQAWCWLAVGVLALSGCGLLPEQPPSAPAAVIVLPPALDTFRLEGRASLRAGEKSFSGGLVWQRGVASEVLLLRNPLGQGVAELHRDATGVELIAADGKHHRAGDAETLLRDVAGLELPLQGLAAWVTGAARPGVPYRAEADAAGQLAVLHQDGWRIEFSRFLQAGGRNLPGRLVGRRDELEVRLVVDQWEAP